MEHLLMRLREFEVTQRIWPREFDSYFRKPILGWQIVTSYYVIIVVDFDICE